jgi:hypothetical protein
VLLGGGLQTSDTGFAIALLRDNRQMLHLKCTGIVQKILKLPKSMLAEALPNPAPLGNWYVNRFDIGRRKAYVFMSETTLLSFILFQGKKPVTVETLPTMLLAGLAQLLNMHGFSEDAIERAMVHYQDGFFARTNSRHDLGSLNDLVQRYQWIIESDGGLDHCDLTSIIMGTNNMPQRRLGWCTSWEVTQSKLLLLS